MTKRKKEVWEKTPTLFEFLKRRNVLLEDWIKGENITSRDDIVEACRRLKVADLSPREIDSLIKRKNALRKLTDERQDAIEASRVVESETGKKSKLKKKESQWKDQQSPPEEPPSDGSKT